MIMNMRWLACILFFLSFGASCQKNIPMDKPVCENAAFEKTVNKLLSYTIPVISVEDVYQNMDTYTLLDAREWEEYKISHLPNARFVGYKTFSANQLKGVDKKAPLIVYCSVGYRSEKVGEKLKAMGYENVHNLYGSIFEWVNHEFPIVNIEGESTRQLHTYNRDWGRHVEPDKCEKVH